MSVADALQCGGVSPQVVVPADVRRKRHSRNRTFASPTHRREEARLVIA